MKYLIPVALLSADPRHAPVRGSVQGQAEGSPAFGSVRPAPRRRSRQDDQADRTRLSDSTPRPKSGSASRSPSGKVLGKGRKVSRLESDELPQIVGDSEIDVEVTLPAEVPGGLVPVSFVGPGGEGQADDAPGQR